MPEQECLFCKIAKGEIPSSKVYEDSSSFAFLDINPRNPGHTLVIPKKHYETVFDMPSSEAGKLFESVKKIAAMLEVGDHFQLVINNGLGQEIDHVHFHFLSDRGADKLQFTPIG